MRVCVWPRRNINFHRQFLASLCLRKSPYREGERKLLFAGRLFFDCNRGPGLCFLNRFFEGKVRLPIVRREFFSPRAIGVDALRQFSAPRTLLHCLSGGFNAGFTPAHSQVFCLCVSRADSKRGDVRGLLNRRKANGKRRITELADAVSSRQYRATLRAYFCHREFCAADASAPVRREPSQDSTPPKNSSTKSGRPVSKEIPRGKEVSEAA